MQEETKKVAPPKAVLRMYWPYVRKHPVLLTCALLSGGAMQIVGLVAPLYMKDFFNVLAAETPSPEAGAALLAILWIIGALWVADRVLRKIEDQANTYLQSGIMAELYERSFAYLMGHSYSFFISNFSGSLTHRISRFSRAFETIADSIIINFFPTALFVIGAVGVLFTRSPWLGLALGAWCVLFICFQVYIGRIRQPIRAARSEADTKVTGALSDSVSNQSTVSLFSGSKFEAARLKEFVVDWRAKTLRNWLVDGWIWFGVGLFVIAIQVGLLWGAVLLWQQGLLTLGDFVLIQAYLFTVFNQLMSIGSNLRRFYDAFADAGEMVAILETPHGVKDKKGAKKLKVTQGEIWFDDIEFYFNDGTSILKQFNLTTLGGERVALVGPSGAGKTTITKLLLRFYDVKKGQITIDGQNIASVTQDSLRDAISFVPQEPILFHRTLMENIRYGRRDASDAEVIKAARQAHCHEFISKLSLGYNTYVGERGVKLSGGERQRVAIARALLKDAPILVLDEATSSLDSQSEALIQDALDTLMQGKTVVVIAHRLSTIMKMDRIVVMENGSIAATGTHLELVNQEGLYRKLWSIQAGGFIGDGHKPSGEPEALSLPDEEETDELAADEKPQ